ncbi:PspC domain-containing protein [Pseudoalteromonas spongiae]|uniref:PspC domain-containing protein n=1 Tax=Pseudoalteromonas spongiae TaxID=298657 RepID=UPI0012FD7ED4|nr:PspC domain-containing protein [Pseudoalteromonas spongiae]
MESNRKVLTRAKHGSVTGTLRGLADYYCLNLNGLQFVFLIAALFGVGFLIYFALWLSIPSYSQRAVFLQELESKKE